MKRRYGERTISLVSWGFWVLLLRPLIILLLWVLGIRLAFIEIYRDKSCLVWKTYLTYFLGVFMICAQLQAWNRYNAIRFRGRERRRRVRDAADEELASYFQISKEDFQRVRGWKKVNVSFSHGMMSIFEDDCPDMITAAAPKLNERTFALPGAGKERTRT